VKSISVKVNKDIPDYPAGSVVDVGCDDSGVPLSRFWRRRLKDSETDQCCEIVKPAATQKPTAPQNTETKQDQAPAKKSTKENADG
jgi:hypothetical protein